MYRKVRDYDLEKFSLDALKEGFRRGRYMLPRKVRRFLQPRMAAYSGRPRMMQAIQMLARIIGQFHTGERNFIERGCGIGKEGAGFVLCRRGLTGPNGFKDLTEALVRESIRFLLEIGFIERITSKGELVEVRTPKNSTTGLGYFRYGPKAKKDALGRIKAPPVLYRLGSATRSLFAKTLRPHQTQNAGLLKEPVWMSSGNIHSPGAVTPVAGMNTGSCPYDTPGHDPADPRFDYARPDPMRDPRSQGSVSREQRRAAQAVLEALKGGTKQLKGLSPAALAIFNRPVPK
jgi:hypothetical protein